MTENITLLRSLLSVYKEEARNKRITAKDIILRAYLIEILANGSNAKDALLKAFRPNSHNVIPRQAMYHAKGQLEMALYIKQLLPRSHNHWATKFTNAVVMQPELLELIRPKLEAL